MLGREGAADRLLEQACWALANMTADADNNPLCRHSKYSCCQPPELAHLGSDLVPAQLPLSYVWPSTVRSVTLALVQMVGSTTVPLYSANTALHSLTTSF